MAVKSGTFSTSSADYSGMKYHKKIYFNKKSFTAMFLSAALLLTSVDCMKVQAEELADQVLPTQTQESGSVSDNTLPVADAATEPDYVKTPEGAVIITSFEALLEDASHFELGEEETLEEAAGRMPATLKASAKVYVAQNKPDAGDDTADEPSGDEESTPGAGDEEQPDDEENTPGAGDEEQPGDGEGNGGEEPGEGEGSGEEEPGEGEGSGGEPAEGDSGGGDSGEQPGDSGDGGNDEQPGDGGDGGNGEQPGDGGDGGSGEQPGDSGAGGNDEQPGDNGGDGSGDQSGDSGSNNGQPEGGEEQSDDSAESQPDAETQSQENDGGNEDAQAEPTDTAKAKINNSFALQDGHQWRLLVAADENTENTDKKEDKGGESGEESNNGSGDGQQPDGGDAGGNGGGQSDEGGAGENGGDGQQPDGGDAGGNGGSGQPDEGGAGENGGDGQQPGGGDAGDNGGGQPGEGGAGENGGNVQPGEGDGQPGGDQPGADAAPGTDGQPGEDTPAADGDAGTTDPAQPTEKVEVEVPVQWECKDADNEEATEYIFRPTWNETVDGTGDKIAWFFDGSENDIPTITVMKPEVEVVAEVSTEEELVAAFAAGLTSIVLKNDIMLTASLVLPATANIELDGQGYSLRRGNVEDKDNGGSSAFIGTMIEMNGKDYGSATFGTLTLKNITVNGKTDANRAGAPVIVDWGHLILEKDAIIKSNYNYGTYTENADGDKVADIYEYGGGVQVYNKLTVKEESSITKNFADMFGGGVYLESGSTLYLYKDVIKNNTVPAETGKGADIYAAWGSTIYYEAGIDMEREGFYFCEGVHLIPLREQGVEDNRPDVEGKEVYISVAEGSGYSEDDVLALKQKLTEKGYKVLANKITYIDTTDLRNWAVYDHYDIGLWAGSNVLAPSNEWKIAYSAYKRRPFYACQEVNGGSSDTVTTIPEWQAALEKGQFGGMTNPSLTRFKEHIDASEQKGCPNMSFAGYGKESYADFLYYDPDSDGEKVVDFDVNSSMVHTHTLAGNGFLVNVGEAGKVIKGYLIYYTYIGNGVSAKADKVYLYKLNDDLQLDTLHNSIACTNADLGVIPQLGQVIAEYKIPADRWDTEMSIQIKVTPNKIEIRQQPKTETKDISLSDPILAKPLENTGYSGFGPLVAYAQHNCHMASSFTYSNLRMYYTHPMLEEKDMLSPLEGADFSQGQTQKYFINLFGEAADREYNDSAKFGQYQEYMQMMQSEGIALITDRETPFKDYLGEPNAENSNLFEIDQGGGLLSVDDLVQKIDESVSGKKPQSTSLKEQVSQNPGDGGLTPASPNQSVGNIWLKSMASGNQVRAIYGNHVEDGGYKIQVMDDITYYHGNEADLSVRYELLKPGRFEWSPLSDFEEGKGDEGESGIAFHGMGVTDDGAQMTPAPFILIKDVNQWPVGQYTVRQTITEKGKECSVKGYAYFTLSWEKEPEPEIPDPPPEDPDPPTPPEPEDPDPPTPPEPVDPDPPGPVKPNNPPKKPSKKPSSSSGGSEPAAVEPYVEETIEVAAGEPVSVAAPAPAPAAEEPEEKNPNEPRTGDMPVATMPVSVGACTAFMMKLRLWLYELETGISEEKKNEILRTLVGWAKGRAMIRVYLAIAATAVVLTAYHLLRALDARRRQVVGWFGR